MDALPVPVERGDLATDLRVRVASHQGPLTKPLQNSASAGLPIVFHLACARDEAGPPVVGDEADEPADEDDQAVLKADEVPEVHREPGRPGREPAQPDHMEVGDCAGAADRREVALVAVAEGP